jgi:hypothetical protein
MNDWVIRYISVTTNNFIVDQSNSCVLDKDFSNLDFFFRLKSTHSSNYFILGEEDKAWFRGEKK